MGKNQRRKTLRGKCHRRHVNFISYTRLSVNEIQFSELSFLTQIWRSNFLPPHRGQHRKLCANLITAKAPESKKQFWFSHENLNNWVFPMKTFFPAADFMFFSSVVSAARALCSLLSRYNRLLVKWLFFQVHDNIRGEWTLKKSA